MAGILHLVGNLYFLLIFGDNVEDYLGWRKYLLLIFGATIAGDFVHLLRNRIHEPSIGASGGISAVLVFYALQFPRADLDSSFAVTGDSVGCKFPRGSPWSCGCSCNLSEFLCN